MSELEFRTASELCELLRTGEVSSRALLELSRLSGYRIAAWLDDADFPVDGEAKRVHGEAIERLRRAGAQIDERARPKLGLRVGGARRLHAAAGLLKRASATTSAAAPSAAATA